MKFEKTDTWGFEHSLRGMRNPKNSWDKSDSHYGFNENFHKEMYNVGSKDMELARALIKGGSEHRKFLRQIFVSVDITAPLYWYKEFDTYKVGTVANSTSTMHKLTSKPITIDCFEIDDYNKQLGLFPERDILTTTDVDYVGFQVESIIYFLETLRKTYLATEDKKYWKELVRWLPESWLQTRTITFNYEVLYNIYCQRKNHKLTEWHIFCKWCETLPYFKEFFSIDK